MTIEQGIVERLGAIAAVTAIVSTRIWQLKLPQNPTLPAIRVQQIGEVEDFHARGPVGLKRSRIQVDAYVPDSGSFYTAGTTLADAIHGNGLGVNATGLSGFIGELGGSPPLIYIAAIFRDSRRPMYEADELRLLRVSQDYLVYWIAMN